MGLYQYIKKTFQKQYSEKNLAYKTRVRAWRRQGALVEINKPTNLSRARNLGYKAKQGYFVVRVRTGKGLRARPKPKDGRKPRHNYKYKAPGHSYRSIAEKRVSRRYPGHEVLNSYWAGSDGQYSFYEVIMIDPIVANVNLQKGRAFRGLTSAGKKSRGLRHKHKKK